MLPRPVALAHVQQAKERIDRGHPLNYFVLGDALRGIACLLVVINHVMIGSVQTFGGVFADGPVGAYGPFSFVGLRIGVPLIYIFFGLSAYLVGGPWVRAWLGDRRAPKAPAFLGRRARRLLPAFWLVLAFRLADGGSYAFTDHQVLGTFLGLQTFYGGAQQALMPQGWTVDVEAFFYLVLPLVFLLAARIGPLARSDRDTRRRALVIFLLAWSVLGIILRTQSLPDGAVGRSVLSLGWAFAPGLLAAAYEKEIRAFAPAHQARCRVGGLVMVAAAIGAWALIIGLQVDDGRLAAELAHLICGAGFIGGALLYEWSGARIPRALDSAPVHAVGRWSYGIYLLHIAIAQQILRHAPDFGPNRMLVYLTVMTYAITIPVAALMWRYWEEPWLDHRWPWVPKRVPAPAEVTAAAPPHAGRAQANA